MYGAPLRRFTLRAEYRDGKIHYDYAGVVPLGSSKNAEMNRLEGKLRELIS